MNPADTVVSGRDGDNPPERPVDPVPGVPGAAAGGWLTRPASTGRVGSLGRRDRASHARPDGDRLRAAAGRLVARLRRAHARRRRPAEPGARPLVARPRRHRLDCLRRAAGDRAGDRRGGPDLVARRLRPGFRRRTSGARLQAARPQGRHPAHGRAQPA